MERDRTNRQIIISQAHYAKQVLKCFAMESCSPVLTPMDPKVDLSPSSEECFSETSANTNTRQLLEASCLSCWAHALGEK